MEVLNVGGKEYVKASVIARELGYTADYVGQLCRGRKVNAKLVGRSWYVDRDSMGLHKEGRYRGSQVKRRKALHEEVKELKSLILENMQTAMPLPHDVPVIAECGEGANWLEAH